MDKEEKAFTRGAACAIATIISSYGIGTETEEAFRACIGSWNDFIQSEPDEYDINILAPHFQTTPDMVTGKE